MDEIDAIGGRRFSEGTSADREIQRTLMELLNQMDGFDKLGQVLSILIVMCYDNYNYTEYCSTSCYFAQHSTQFPHVRDNGCWFL